MNINTANISLRKASENDVDTLAENRIVFLKEAYGDTSPELESLLRTNLREYFTRSLRNGIFISWIAEYENKAVGFCGMVIREQPGNFEIPHGKTGYILNIFTIKPFRKKGIASLLVQKLIDEGRQKKLDKIELHATTDGEPVYKRIGFTEPHDRALEIILK